MLRRLGADVKSFPGGSTTCYYLSSLLRSLSSTAEALEGKKPAVETVIMLAMIYIYTDLSLSQRYGEHSTPPLTTVTLA